MWFSRTYPERRGLLFAINNEAALGGRHAQQLKALGVFAGVSDLIYIRDGIIVGIEMKVKGSRHDKEHVERQIKWGEAIVKAGGEYYICTSLMGFIQIIFNEVLNTSPGFLNLYNCRELLNNSTKKSIVF